jgi:hypothetical protein
MKSSELFVNLAAINMISKAKTHHVWYYVVAKTKLSKISRVFRLLTNEVDNPEPKFLYFRKFQIQNSRWIRSNFWVMMVLAFYCECTSTLLLSA